MPNDDQANATSTAHASPGRDLTLIGIVLIVAFALTRWVAVPADVTESDEVLFCFAVDKFDLSRHHPHPPGYPVYVAMGKLAAASGVANFTALAWVGLLASCSAVWPLYRLARDLVRAPRPLAYASCALYGACPVVWINSARALADVPATALAVWVAWLLWRVVQRRAGVMERLSTLGDAAIGAARVGVRPELALRLWFVGKRAFLAPGRKTYLIAAVVAAVGIGARPQLAVVFVPLLALVSVTGNIGVRVTLAAAVIAAGVCLAWLVPMIVASGGVSAFREHFVVQTEWYLRYDTAMGEPTATWRDRVDYWLNLWGADATRWPMLALIAMGVVRLCARGRRAAVFVGMWLLPYAAFVLVAHSPATPRYALPAIAPLVLLATAAIVPLPRAGPVVAAALAIGLAAQGWGLVWRFHSERIPPLRAASWIAANATAGDTFVLDQGLEVVIARHEAALPWRIARSPDDEQTVSTAKVTWLLTAHPRSGREASFALEWKGRRYRLFTRERFQTAYVYRFEPSDLGK